MASQPLTSERMKLFYETYGQNPKLAPLVREIAWSHNVAIMEPDIGSIKVADNRP